MTISEGRLAGKQLRLDRIVGRIVMLDKKSILALLKQLKKEPTIKQRQQKVKKPKERQMKFSVAISISSRLYLTHRPINV